jgi:hypothetical protein
LYDGSLWDKVSLGGGSFDGGDFGDVLILGTEFRFGGRTALFNRPDRRVE